MKKTQKADRGPAMKCPCCEMPVSSALRMRTQITTLTHAYLCPPCHAFVMGEQGALEGLEDPLTERQKLVDAFVAAALSREGAEEPARCGKCRKQLDWIDLLPLFSRYREIANGEVSEDDLRCVTCQTYELAREKIGSPNGEQGNKEGGGS